MPGLAYGLDRIGDSFRLPEQVLLRAYAVMSPMTAARPAGLPSTQVGPSRGLGRFGTGRPATAETPAALTLDDVITPGREAVRRPRVTMRPGVPGSAMTPAVPSTGVAGSCGRAAWHCG